MGGFGNIARAFSSRNYRIYVTGNSISLTGTWLQRLAIGWLAWQLTHSGTWLGLVSFADLFPTVVLSPWAGALADRAERIRVIWVSQCIATTQAVILALLTWFNAIDIIGLFTLAAMMGIANAINQPARLALIPDLVDRANLPSAVAINSIVFNGARFIGPMIAGIVIAHGGISLAFALNAASYIAFAVALARLDLPRGKHLSGERKMLRAMIDGYLYAARHPGIGAMLMLMAVTSLGTRGFIEMLPGFGLVVSGIGAQTLVQSAVDTRMRGRVMALYGMIFRGGPALGAVLTGTASSHFGLRLPIAAGALLCAAYWVWARLSQPVVARELEAIGNSAE